MNVYEAISMRRSIRRFKPDPIPEEKLVKIMEAARLAPSAGNLQPWVFIVIKNYDMKYKLAEAADNQLFIARAPLIIAVFGDPDNSPTNYQRNPMIAFKQDPMIAVEHMCLTALEEGLGSCWIGPASPDYDHSKIKQLLKVPDRMYMICLLPIGYPDEYPPNKKRKAMSEIFFSEKYGNRYKN